MHCMTHRVLKDETTMQRSKDVLTTGQVAKICKVAPRTVSKWFDSGQLRGYRIPGSKDRRIPLNHLIKFMREHGIPLNGLEVGAVKIVVVDSDDASCQLLREALNPSAGFDVTTVGTAFEAGIAIESHHPAIVIVDVSLPDIKPGDLIKHIRATDGLEETRLIAVSGALTDGQGQEIMQTGFDAFFKKPFDMPSLIRRINEMTGP